MIYIAAEQYCLNWTWEAFSVCASCSEASVAGVCATVACVDPLSTGPNSVQAFCYINHMLIQKMRGIIPAGADRWRAAAGRWLRAWPLASSWPGRHPSLLSCTCDPHTSGAFHTWICLHLFGSKTRIRRVPASVSGLWTTPILLSEMTHDQIGTQTWEKKKDCGCVFLQCFSIMILLHLCFCSFHHIEYEWVIAHALICWERTSTRKEHELVRHQLVNKEPLR